MRWDRESGPSLSSLPTIKPTPPQTADTNTTLPSRQGTGARERHDTWVPRNDDRQQRPPMAPRRMQEGPEPRYNPTPQTQWNNDRNAAGSSRPRREGFRNRNSQFSEGSNSRSHFWDNPGSAVNQKPHREQALKPKPQARAPKAFKRPAVEVYIPSTVPVGTLSKILKVRLGTYGRGASLTRL